MSRKLGAQIGLLAFGMAIIAGLYAGNSPSVILMRALVAMVIGVFVGQGAGMAGRLILREHLQRIKQQIDLEHLAAIKVSMSPLGESVDDVAEEAVPQATSSPEVGQEVTHATQ